MAASARELTEQLRTDLATPPKTLPAAVAWLSTVLRLTGHWTAVAGHPVLDIATDSRVLAHRVTAETYRLAGRRARVIETGSRRSGSRFLVRIADRPAVVARVTEIADRRGRPTEGLAPLVVGGSEPVRTAALRAAICVAGNLSSPARATLSISCPTMAVALAVKGLVRRLDIPSRLKPAADGTCRVDITGDDVARVLSTIGADAISERWSEARNLTAGRAAAQRIDNFDNANATRSLSTAQIAAARVGRAFEILGADVPDHLLVIGRLRQEHPHASLHELGQLADPPVSKDTAAGRIRRLLHTADTTARNNGVPDTFSAVPDDLRATG